LKKERSSVLDITVKTEDRSFYSNAYYLAIASVKRMNMAVI